MPTSVGNSENSERSPLLASPGSACCLVLSQISVDDLDFKSKRENFLVYPRIFGALASMFVAAAVAHSQLQIGADYQLVYQFGGLPIWMMVGSITQVINGLDVSERNSAHSKQVKADAHASAMYYAAGLASCSLVLQLFVLEIGLYFQPDFVPEQVGQQVFMYGMMISALFSIMAYGYQHFHFSGDQYSARPDVMGNMNLAQGVGLSCAAVCVYTTGYLFLWPLLDSARALIAFGYMLKVKDEALPSSTEPDKDQQGCCSDILGDMWREGSWNGLRSGSELLMVGCTSLFMRIAGRGGFLPLQVGLLPANFMSALAFLTAYAMGTYMRLKVGSSADSPAKDGALQPEVQRDYSKDRRYFTSLMAVVGLTFMVAFCVTDLPQTLFPEIRTENLAGFKYVAGLSLVWQWVDAWPTFLSQMLINVDRTQQSFTAKARSGAMFLATAGAGLAALSIDDGVVAAIAALLVRIVVTAVLGGVVQSRWSDVWSERMKRCASSDKKRSQHPL